MLYYTITYYTILYCTVLYYTILYASRDMAAPREESMIGNGKPASFMILGHVSKSPRVEVDLKVRAPHLNDCLATVANWDTAPLHHPANPYDPPPI